MMLCSCSRAAENRHTYKKQEMEYGAQ